MEILLAEDSPTQAEKLRYLLESEGSATRTATDGRQALSAARQHRPALIISDVMMPVMDGFTFCNEIKHDERLKDIPVILLTSLSDIRDIMKGLECGADNFIRKPYEDQYLLARVDYLLMNHEMRKSQKLQMGMEIYLGGQKHFITAERQQIVDLLISIYEDAIHLNKELHARQLELAHSNHLLTGLYRIAEGLNRAVTEREVCEKALEYALELPGVQAGWLYLWNNGAFQLAASCNEPPLLAVGRIEASCDCWRLFLSGELGRAARMINCSRLMPDSDHSFSLPCHASIPLCASGQNLGIMNLMGRQQGPFTDSELETFYGVGHQVSIALERARLHEQMEKLVEDRTTALTAEISRRKEYEARIVRLNRIHAVLSGINTTIVRVREIQELFDEACRIAAEHGQFVFAWIGLFNWETQSITPMARAGNEEGYLAHLNFRGVLDAPGNSWLIAEAITSLRPAICNDLARDERARRWPMSTLDGRYNSTVVLPLTLEGKLVGIFMLYAAETGFFDEEEMTLLIEMAGDISFAMDHLEKEERLHYLAFFDAVTGLPNRSLFLDRVDQRISTFQDSSRVLSVVILDLERFSSINESLGHQAGDSLLRQLAQRLKHMLADTDILAHLSSDHFALAISHEEESTDIAHALEKILFGIQDRPFLVGGQELRISARAGASSYPLDGHDTDSLLRNAETALKKAKLSWDKHLYYAPEFNARVTEKLKLETKLRRALEEEQLILHYQPKIDLESGHISGLEALMRWQDPENGLVPPLSFIPLLEETRMILDAGRWALGKAISDFKKWQALGLNPPKIAVNVSPIQLRQKDFVSMVASALHQAGNVAIGLELEITESVIMQDIEKNIEKLKVIRDMNVEVAIDDFGTGYSSLSYIAKLPVSVLKVDRAFIVNMTSNPDDLNIVSAIISLAHSLHLRVIAEGVETDEQADLLRMLKCDEMQGYLFSPGVNTVRIEQFLREKKSLPAAYN
jgi:diguanylate cyclase (GGDEF)-like protein